MIFTLKLNLQNHWFVILLRAQFQVSVLLCFEYWRNPATWRQELVTSSVFGSTFLKWGGIEEEGSRGEIAELVNINWGCLPTWFQAGCISKLEWKSFLTGWVGCHEIYMQWVLKASCGPFYCNLWLNWPLSLNLLEFNFLFSGPLWHLHTLNVMIPILSSVTCVVY